MPSVTVPVPAFQNGELPRVCARTGAPATTSRRLVVVRRGALGDATGKRRRMLGKGLSRVVGEVPLSEPAARRTAVIERVRAVLAGVAAAGFVVGIFTALWLLLSASLLAVLLGLSLYLTVGGELDKRGETVTLLHVHPAFAAAVGQGASRSGGAAR